MNKLTKKKTVPEILLLCPSLSGRYDDLSIFINPIFLLLKQRQEMRFSMKIQLDGIKTKPLLLIATGYAMLKHITQ